MPPNDLSKLQKKIEKKLRRHQHALSKATGVTCSDTPTKTLGICNAGHINGLTEEILVEEFQKYGTIDNIVLLPGKSCAFLRYTCLTAAIKAFDVANGQLKIAQNGKPVYLSYVNSLPDITNEKVFNTMPPGLIIIQNFVTESEEQELLALCEFGDSTGNMKHRQVKHYGYEFRYDINNVEKDNPLSETIPVECSSLWKRLDFDFCPDQLTVNRYEPGQGIPPHIDTHSAFEDPILSLSLNADVVMEFKKNETVCVLLPRRSLAIIGGEARYDWTHAIVPRKFDFYHTSEGFRFFKRGTRISFTFRKILSGSCNCNYKSNCDSQAESTIDSGLACKLEQQHVHEVYDDIAQHFCETRHKPWPRVLEFVQKLPAGAVLVDVGCGNGKYFGYNRHILEIGLDSSLKLNELCKDRGFQVFTANCLNLPLRSNTADGVISIAVVHHLSTENRRLGALCEIARILREGGEALVYVWAKQQIKNREKSTYIKQDRKNWKGDGVNLDTNRMSVADGINLPVHTNRTDFNHSDVLVPWKLKTTDDAQTFFRFYHVFEEGELDELCRKIPGISVVESYYDQGNYCIKLRKNKI